MKFQGQEGVRYIIIRYTAVEFAHENRTSSYIVYPTEAAAGW